MDKMLNKGTQQKKNHQIVYTNCMNSISSLCVRKTLIKNSGNIIYCIIPTAAALKITA